MEEELCHEDGDVIMDELAGDDEPTESERLAAEGPPVESEGDNLLKPHDQLWKEIPGGVDVCWRTSWGKRKWNPVLKWRQGEAASFGVKSRLETWELVVLAPLAGLVICIDENTIKWSGLKHSTWKKVCPHITNIACKLEPVCI